MKNKVIAGFVFLLLTAGCIYEPLCSFNTEDVTNMYQSYVEEWQQEAQKCFEEAEKEVFNNPAPKPDDIVGPHQDPKKCICKGTGVIVQGDDHVTPCPFHSKAHNAEKMRIK